MTQWLRFTGKGRGSPGPIGEELVAFVARNLGVGPGPLDKLSDAEVTRALNELVGKGFLMLQMRLEPRLLRVRFKVVGYAPGHFPRKWSYHAFPLRGAPN